MKSKIVEIKNSLEGFNSIYKQTDERTRKLKNMIAEEQKEKKRIKGNEQSLRNQWNTIKHINTHIIELKVI